MTDLQLGYLNLKLNQEKLAQEMELGHQQLEETSRHNRATEDAAREQLLVNWFDANSGRMNAESNAKNAESNRMNAETNRLNYSVNLMNARTNQYNAQTNRMNAETNRLNYQVNAYSAVSGRMQAEAAQQNARTAASRESWEHQYAAQEQSRANEILPYQRDLLSAQAKQYSARGDLASAQTAGQHWQTRILEDEWASGYAAAKAKELESRTALNQQQIDSGYWAQHTELEQQKSQNLTGQNWGQWISNIYNGLSLPANLYDRYKDIFADLGELDNVTSWVLQMP